MEGFDYGVFLKFLGAYFAMVNPLLGVPVFIAMTDGYSKAERIRAALVVSATIAVVGLVSVMAGEEVLSIFGIGIPAFRVAGGLIIVGIGLAMLNADTASHSERLSREAPEPERSNITVVPLAIPMTIGPGAIVSSIVFSHQVDERAEFITLAPVVLIVAVVMAVSLLFAEPITRLLGRNMMSVLSRVFAIVLVAIAVEMILTGLGDEIRRQFPDLGGTGS